MVTKRDWHETPGLADLLQAPYPIQKDIQSKYFPAQAQKDELVEYWLTTSSSASWETLVYRLKEEGISCVCLVTFLEHLLYKETLIGQTTQAYNGQTI